MTMTTDAPNSPENGSRPARAATRADSRSARRQAREFALQGVYAWLLRGDADSASAASAVAEITEHLRDHPDFGGADVAWFDTLLGGVLRDAPALRRRFAPYLDRSVDELSPVEHAVLLIGSFELTHHLEVPWRVVINEAVELTKSFGGADGFKFVNGVLDKLAAEVRAAEVGGTRGVRR